MTHLNALVSTAGLIVAGAKPDSIEDVAYVLYGVIGRAKQAGEIVAADENALCSLLEWADVADARGDRAGTKEAVRQFASAAGKLRKQR